MLSFCLLFDKDFVEEGWVSCLSILRQNPKTKIYVLCLDDETLAAMSCRPVLCIPLEFLERHYPALLDVKGNRTWPAYTQTVKVFLPTYVFDKFDEDELCYVDSDVLFWSDHSAITEALGDRSFMVASRESPVRAPQGDYNGGFFACRDDTNSRRFFAWWQARCLEWCDWAPGPDGKYTEEGYLNIITDDPDKFQGVRICSNPGINLAKWNAHRHNIERSGDGFVVDGQWPLVCFHYKGFCPDLEWFGLGGPPDGDLRLVFEGYRDALMRS